MNLFLVGLLGGCAGLRTFTPLAVLCWFAWHRTIHLSGWRGFAASLIAAIPVTLVAVGELYGDKQPTTPSRLALPGLLARVVLGAFGGLVLAQPLLLNPAAAVAAGAAGAIAGAYSGWFVRTRTVAALKCPDWMVAIAEDAVAIGLSITFLHLLAVHGTLFLGNEGILLGK